MANTRLINLKQAITPVERKRVRRANGAEMVPHRCTRCRGTGQAPCQVCAGSGETLRGRDLFGRLQFSRCCGCFGTKSTRCSACGGVGWV